MEGDDELGLQQINLQFRLSKYKLEINRKKYLHPQIKFYKKTPYWKASFSLQGKIKIFLDPKRKKKSHLFSFYKKTPQ